jgi:exopolysaccharide biosynthesis predicted pyruvyltransferase EpsI
MCENIKDNSTEIKSENEAILREILAQYSSKKDILLDGAAADNDDDESIYSAEEAYMPQELMAVVFLGTN